MSKLEALFDHPLYNMADPHIPEEDWLLKVKPKVKASEKSSQMWSVSFSLPESNIHAFVFIGFMQRAAHH